MKKIYLEKSNTNVFIEKNGITMTYKQMRKTLLVELISIISFLAILSFFMNIGVSELFIVGLIISLIWIATIQITVLMFNTDKNQITLKYCFGNISFRNKIILNNFKRYNYEIKFETRSNGELNYSGYFLIAHSKYKSHDIFRFLDESDSEIVRSILRNDLGLKI